MNIMLDMHMHQMHSVRMKLSKYLTSHKLTDAAFAGMVGMSQSQVSRLRRGKSLPSWDTVAIIEKATKGAVRSDDFVPAKKVTA